MGEVIAVLSGKGGTGKTSVCGGLAQALAQQGETVLCVDCSFGLGDLDITLGISQLSALSVPDICSGNYTLEQALRHPQFPGLAFISAPVSSTVKVDADAFSRMLDDARSKFSYVLLDGPAGMGEGFQLTAEYADRVILVTTADPAAIRAAARTGDALEIMGKANVRMIVNRADPRDLNAMGVTVDDLMDRAGLPLLGLIPEDEKIFLAAVAQKPLLSTQKKGAAAACQRIAKRIRGQNVPVKL